MAMKKTVKITIGVSDAFKGTLRCSLTLSDETQDFPSRLKSVSITPLSELKNRPKASSSTTLEPLPKKNPTELDLSTLNILLSSMKSVVVLADSSRRQFVYEPSTSSTATLAPYHSTGGAAPKSRLASKAMSDSNSQLSLGDLIEGNNKAAAQSDKLVKNALAWFYCLEKGEDEPLIMLDLAESITNCIERNEPTPQYLVTQMIPNVILGWTHVVDRLKMKQVISELWMTKTAMQARIRSRDDGDHAKLLRQIQLQGLLRLQLLAMDRKGFLKVFSKQLTDHKSKRRSGGGDLISEVTTIFEGACFLLKVGTTLPEMLGETFPASLYCSIPGEIQEIFDFFECPNPFLKDVAEDDDAVSDRSCSLLALEAMNEHPPSPSIRSPKKKQKRHSSEVPSRRSVKFEDEVPPPKSFVEGMQHADLTLRSVHLTARRSRTNPLLKDSKASYVGSHFNTKLANISAHYHEVPIATKKSRSTTAHAPRHTTSAPPKKAMTPLRNKFVVLETPSRRVGGESGRDRLGMVQKKEVLFGCDDDKVLVVGESPVKRSFSSAGINTNEENRVLPFSLPEQPTRKPFSIANHNSGTSSQRTKQPKLEKKASSNARRMAQEALAATRRV
jgi:hypothetical protein